MTQKISPSSQLVQKNLRWYNFLKQKMILQTLTMVFLFCAILAIAILWYQVKEIKKYISEKNISDSQTKENSFQNSQSSKTNLNDPEKFSESNNIQTVLEELTQRLTNNETQINKLNEKHYELQSHLTLNFNHLPERIEAVDQRISSTREWAWENFVIQSNYDSVLKRITQQYQYIGDLEQKVNALKADMNEHINKCNLFYPTKN